MRDGALDFDRPNPIAFRHFETQVAALGAMGVEADVIIFHPYDRWGYCAMSAEQDDRHVRYLVARLGAYRNVWWSLANEYDFSTMGSQSPGGIASSSSLRKTIRRGITSRSTTAKRR
jgi:hypothetical protein